MAQSSAQTQTEPELQRIPHLPNEILLQIISFCERDELATLCRVSQDFNTLATPSLYKEVIINTNPHDELRYFFQCIRSLNGESEFFGQKKGVPKARFVERLEVDVMAGISRKDFWDGPGVQTGFVSMVCDRSELYISPGWHTLIRNSTIRALVDAQIEALLVSLALGLAMALLTVHSWASKWFGISKELHKALTHMPRLESIDIAMGPCDFQNAGISGYSQLKTAHLWNVGHNSVRRLRELREGSPNLQNLELSMSSCIEDSWDEIEEVEFWEGLFPNHEKKGTKPLTSLKLVNCPLPNLVDNSWDFNTVGIPRKYSYLKELRHLKELTLSRCWTHHWMLDEDDDDGFFFGSKKFGKSLRNLETLVIHSPTDECLHGLPSFFKLSPKLRSLTLFFDDWNMYSIIDSLSDIGATLEVLVLEHIGYRRPFLGKFNIGMARKLVRDCPNLTQLSLDERLLFSDWVEIASLFVANLRQLSALKIRSGVSEIKEFQDPSVVNDMPSARTRAKTRAPSTAAQRHIQQTRHSTVRTSLSCVKNVLSKFHRGKHDALRHLAVNELVYKVDVKRNMLALHYQTSPFNKDLVKGSDVPWIFRAREGLKPGGEDLPAYF